MLFPEGQQDTCYRHVQETVLSGFLIPASVAKARGKAMSSDQEPQEFSGAALGGYPKPASSSRMKWAEVLVTLFQCSSS